ncbi:vp1054 [Leucania separata nucleopolyhedrovirus]|uniref:Vp1054 n=1 Tax=Leucania separata nucleopolyhedrovirus TaxID=1307956 RepID=Q0IL55_NPVLS|nr:vp1054 [Leucania separata nucleopolyhedrovirus]AAR28828.1 vp1054 [Leucania separata nucleopolyhedrovirus]
MSSTTIVRYRQCVSERSVSFKPITFRKSQCPLHPSRANCQVTQDPDSPDRFTHFTFIEQFFKQYDGTPYYVALFDRDALDLYGKLDVAEKMACYVHIDQVDADEKFATIDEAGERNMAVIRIVLKSVIECMMRVRDRYLLMFDEPYIDLVYSNYRTVVLPQRMYTLFTSETAPVYDAFDVFNLPESQTALESQNIYKTFLVYNTILTLVLKQSNPFNERNKNISVIFRNLGTCPNNSRRVKCCDLKYGGGSPGHFMCPTKEIVRRVFKYAKWARNPNNYKRYYELIMRPIHRERRHVPNRADAIQPARELDLIVLDWYNFMDDFKGYFLQQQ